MAQFKYLGEPPRPELVASYGPTQWIKVPKKDGTMTELYKEAGFPVGAVITDAGGQPVDFTDDMSLIVLRADTERFEEVI